MLRELGGFFGGVTIFFYAMAVLNFVVKFVNKKFRPILSKNENFYKFYLKFMKFIIKEHKLFGILTVVSLLIHFSIQFSQYGINIAGVVAAGIMLLQVILGITMKKTSKGKKPVLITHRIIAAALLISIIIHVA